MESELAIADECWTDCLGVGDAVTAVVQKRTQFDLRRPRWTLQTSAVRPDFEPTQPKRQPRWLEIVSDDRAITSARRSFPVAIHTLGRFGIVLDGAPLSFPCKTPKKPLDLLKALIARGGRCVDIDDIMNLLWPKLGRAARSAFDVTLMRLRRLLRVNSALTLSDGKLTLNEQICWVDVWALERAIARHNKAADNEPDRSALDLYRGRFLDREGNAPWIVNMRDRLAAKFRRVVLNLARTEEYAQRWNDAARFYRLGLEHDNLTEEFYYRLMHCELRLGQKGEAVNTYRRCRDLLSVNLQAKPSAELEALYRRALSS